MALLKSLAPSRLSASGLNEIRPLDRADLSFEVTDSMVMDSVYWFGTRGYEGILVDIWEALCGQSKDVLEIGGNVGFYSVVGGKAAKGRYTVLEPVPEIAALLRANLDRNGLKHVDVLSAAAIAGTKAQDVWLNLPDEHRSMPVGAHLVEGTELRGRSSARHISVSGMPFSGLAAGRDLIKIDAEGVEAQLLNAASAELIRSQPTLVLEVLPEATQLAAVIVELAGSCGYSIQIVPAYGRDDIVTVTPAEFTSATPARYNSKDVVLSLNPLVLPS